MLQSKRLYFLGFLSYIIFQKLFYCLSGLANILLIYFDISKSLYITILILSGIISLLFLVVLFRYIMKLALNSRRIMTLFFVLVIVVLSYFGINKYAGYLAENDKSVGIETLKYFAYPEFIFAATMGVSILLLLTLIKRRESK